MSASHMNGMVEPPSSGNGAGPQEPAAWSRSEVADPAHAMAGGRPEVAVGAAFVGGLVLALLLRRVRS